MRKVLYLLGEPLDIQTLYEQSIYIVFRFKNGEIRKDMTGYESDLAVWLNQGTNLITGSTQSGAITLASTANDSILDEMRIFIDFIGTNTVCPAPYSYNYRLNIEKDGIDTFALNGKFVILDVAPDDFQIEDIQPSTVTFVQTLVSVSVQTMDVAQLRNEALLFRNQAEVFKNSASNSAVVSANSATLASQKATDSANSATQSANSATASANSATASANSATQSANSATASANSATNAQVSADGASATAQTVGNVVNRELQILPAKAGSAMNIGTPVYVSSADGTNIIVSPASNASEATSSKVIGLLMQTLANNGQGSVVTGGKLVGLNTSTASLGNPVWLGVNGALIYGLTNKPVAPAHLVYLGAVSRIHATLGEIIVHIQNGFEFNEIHNYLEAGLQDGDVIQYESSSGLYKNKHLSQSFGGSPNAIMSQKAVLEFVNKNKALFEIPLQAPIGFEKFTSEGSTASVTYINGVVTNSHNNDFLIASSVEELREIEIGFNKQWYCIGYDLDGNALIVATSFVSGQLGKVRKMLPNGVLSDVATGVLPNSEIPTNATRIRINTENNSITISYTTDNTIWTTWGTVAITAITGYTSKKLGFLTYKLDVNKSATIYSFKRADTYEHTVVVANIEQTDNLDSKFLLVGGGVKGIQKLPKANAKQALGFVTQAEIETAKALFSLNTQPAINFEKFTSEGSTAGVTYINGVVTATHTAGYMGGFMIASSVEELREIVVSNNRQWLCLGYDSTGKAIIVSVNGDNIGKALRIATTGVLSESTQLFPVTRIPENATRIRINTENNSITISYTTDNTIWTTWGTVAITAITGYSSKKLGFLSHVGYPTPRTLTVYSHKRAEIEDTSYSLVLEGIEETASDTDKWYLLGGGSRGLQKFKKPTVTPINYGKIEYLGDSIIEQGVSIIADFYSGIATVYNNGHSGHCYGAGGAGTLNNTTFLNAIISHAPDFVFLQAGTNDFGNNVVIGSPDSSNVNEMSGGLNAIINTIQTALPNCRIIISTPSPRYYTGSTQFQANGIGKYYVEYVDAIISVAARHSIIVNDRWRKMGVNQYNKNAFTTDGLHLKPAGYARMLEADLALLKTLV